LGEKGKKKKTKRSEEDSVANLEKEKKALASTNAGIKKSKRRDG